MLIILLGKYFVKVFSVFFCGGKFTLNLVKTYVFPLSRCTYFYRYLCRTYAAQMKLFNCEFNEIDVWFTFESFHLHLFLRLLIDQDEIQVGMLLNIFKKFDISLCLFHYESHYWGSPFVYLLFIYHA